MATLVAVIVGDRIVARCDSRCYDGKTPPETCKCLCGGENHGVGLERAIANASRSASRWKRHWQAAHPDLAAVATFKVYRYTLATQLSFLPEMDLLCAVSI